jgi:hydroxypyruvate reductase 1
MRAGAYHGWLPSMLLGSLLYRGTLGIVGAGRIGAAYARMLMEGHKMDLLYYDVRENKELEAYVAEYGAFLAARGEAAVTCRRANDLPELLGACNVVSVHAALTPETRHLIGAPELAAMKEDAVLVNASRGPLVDEAALVEHCRAHPRFRAGLDVYEREPAMAPGLAALDNVVLVPHLGSATTFTREGMATLAAANVVAMLGGWPVWPAAAGLADVAPFLEGEAPQAAPSIVNADELGLARLAAPAAARGDIS